MVRPVAFIVALPVLAVAQPIYPVETIGQVPLTPPLYSCSSWFQKFEPKLLMVIVCAVATAVNLYQTSYGAVEGPQVAPVVNDCVALLMLPDVGEQLA